MRSFRVKYKQNNLFFKVEFSFFNDIKDFDFVEKDDATIFQPESNVIKLPGGEMCLGKIKCTQFSFFLSEMGVKEKDVELEEFDMPEIVK